MFDSRFIQFRNRMLFFVAISGIAFYLLVPIGGAVDLYLIQPWVSPTGVFLYRQHWFLTSINHQLLKSIIIVFYLAVLLLWLALFRFKHIHFKHIQLSHWRLGYFFWISLLSTSMIGLIKSQSNHACPWNMTTETVTGFVWDFSLKNGHCFPGGHASSGFILVTGFFAYRLSQPRVAKAFLLIGLILGFAMGWGQMMRGAHFMSHNLWTGWMILALNSLLYCYFYQKDSTLFTAKHRL